MATKREFSKMHKATLFLLEEVLGILQVHSMGTRPSADTCKRMILACVGSRGLLRESCKWAS